MITNQLLRNMPHFLSTIIHYPQAVVDRVGMYRTVTLALLSLLVCSLIAGSLDWLAYSPITQLIAVIPAITIGLILNIAVAKILNIKANHESVVISSLILFFLVIPEASLTDNWALYAAVVVAVLSKFLLVYKKQHIFNAAAFGAVALSLPGFYEFSWWVSNPVLFLPIVVLGGLVVMKVRRWPSVLWFIGIGLLVFLFEEWRFQGVDVSFLSSFQTYFLSWPTLFLAFFMLTEPFTTPSTKKAQAWYGVIVGALANTAIFVPFFAMSPELALLLGSLAVYPFRLRQKLFLTFISKREIGDDTYEFLFEKPAGFRFESGQYLEWMLPHKADSRGERRYFTIASSPTEDKVRLALKVVSNGSTYKKELMALTPGEVIICSQLSGDFLLPVGTNKKLGFIAGGIGVTPFSSHLQYMADSGTTFDTTLLYCANTVADLAYYKEFQKLSESLPLNVIPVVAKEKVSLPMESGYVTKATLESRVPDYRDRQWYLSGPSAMVNAYDELLRSSGVSRKNIIKDFFPGLA
jgi:ferredoxin-NADP reductase/Na+-translocating ferredoxin:NAD+ oxidoreductase RnfD subunit